MTRILTLATALAVAASVAAAQEPDIRTRLIGAGAPAEFADRVAAIVEGARSEGLPVGPLEAKAVEGWAKRNRVPPERVTTLLERMRTQLREADGIAAQMQVGAPHRGDVVAAAAEALGRGMTPEHVRELIRSAPTPEAAAAGLTVAASLAAQGLDHAAAVRAVDDQHRAGGAPQQIFELPSAMADLLARGMPIGDVARQILEGGGLPLPGGAGTGMGQGRPGAVPPTRGPVIDPPGNRGNQGNRGRQN